MQSAARIFLQKERGPQRTPYGNIAAPPSGYLWDAAKRAGVSVRSYGIFAHRGAVDEEDSGKGPVDAFVPGLKGFVHPDYPAYDLKIPDNVRVDIWLKEFRKFEKEGGLPQLSLIQLPNDHTASTYPGYPTPRAMVAENDLALGRLVEEISKSKFWKESAIFVIEDDAQDGPDHVDSHRSVALIISPYVRKGVVDSTMYTTSGILRTMELILGLEPLSQYDAAAQPAYASFQEQPDTKPYVHRPAKISITEKNGDDAYGAAESMSMNLVDVDRAPMREMNEILWKSIRGANSVMPPPVRSGFIHPVEEDEEDDEHSEIVGAALGPPGKSGSGSNGRSKTRPSTREGYSEYFSNLFSNNIVRCFVNRICMDGRSLLTRCSGSRIG